MRIANILHMLLNIIHLEIRIDRRIALDIELQKQEISAFRIWDGIINEANPRTGISKAHKQIISKAKESGLHSVLIAEDDIKFTAKGAFEYFLNNIPADFDLYLGGITHGKINSEKVVNDFSGLTLYLIHNRFYNTFLDTAEDLNIDRALAGKGKYVVCDPFVAIQHNGYSDNMQIHCEYDLCYKGRKLYGQ